MKLHWSSRSPYVRKVMVAAHELGVADRLHTVRTLVAMTKTNVPLLAHNPLAKIPTLVLDDGTALYDSLVICEYLASLPAPSPTAPRLFPQPGPARWTALTWHALGNGLLDTLILWRNEREKPEPRQTPEWLEGFALKTGTALDRMHTIVPDLEAAPLAIGHITLAVALSYLDFRFPGLQWRNHRDSLAAWHATIEARPSMQATRPIDA